MASKKRMYNVGWSAVSGCGVTFTHRHVVQLTAEQAEALRTFFKLKVEGNKIDGYEVEAFEPLDMDGIQNKMRDYFRS